MSDYVPGPNTRALLATLRDDDLAFNYVEDPSVAPGTTLPEHLLARVRPLPHHSPPVAFALWCGWHLHFRPKPERKQARVTVL